RRNRRNRFPLPILQRRQLFPPGLWVGLVGRREIRTLLVFHYRLSVQSACLVLQRHSRRQWESRIRDRLPTRRGSCQLWLQFTGRSLLPDTWKSAEPELLRRLPLLRAFLWGCIPPHMASSERVLHFARGADAANPSGAGLFRG